MTHELKFRYVYGIPGKPETYFFNINTIEEIEKEGAMPLMFDNKLEIISRDQFTGKKDVENNIELYENDRIIAHRFYFDGYGESEQEIESTIKWDDGHCAFMIGDIKDDGNNDQEMFLLSEFDYSNETAFTLIGNIYGISTKNDNPNPNEDT